VSHDYLTGSTAQQIADSIRSAQLPGGTKLPPIRVAAEQLDVSPATVSAAWGLLSRAGLIDTDGRRGTRVRGNGSIQRRYSRALDRRSAVRLDLSTGLPDAALLPDLRPSLQRVGHLRSTGSYLDEPVLAALGQALRADWPYEPETFAVLDGAMDALDQVATTHLRYGDRVAVEEPAFPPLLDLLDALGVRPLGLAMDDQGVVTAGLAAALKQGVRAVFLQPRAQNPTGVSLSAGRARELRTVLRRYADVLIIEDDSAGLVAATEPVTLAQWLPARTVHIRSYSKSHGPDLRLAAASGPHALLDPVVNRRALGQGWSSRLLQSVLADLLTDAKARKQVDKARAEYARRRAAVVKVLQDQGIAVTGGDGLNLWLPVLDETAALLHLAGHGITAAAGTPFWIDTTPVPHLRLTIGLLGTELTETAAIVAAAADAAPRTGPR
jgi:DNA-binding transcriptional MocR family regulator